MADNRDDDLIPIGEVARMIKKSRAWLYVKEHREALYAQGFPRPRNEAVLGLWWVRGKVRAWIEGEPIEPGPAAPGMRELGATPANDGEPEVDYAALARDRMRAAGGRL